MYRKFSVLAFRSRYPGFTDLYSLWMRKRAKTFIGLMIGRQAADAACAADIYLEVENFGSKAARLVKFVSVSWTDRLTSDAPPSTDIRNACQPFSPGRR